MRLVDLDPHWIMQDGKRIGFTFVGPKHRDPRNRQSCFVESPDSRTQNILFGKMYGADPDDGEQSGPIITQGCKKGTRWTIEGGIDNASFENISVTPSIDGSAGGNWHGHITNGEIV